MGVGYKEMYHLFNNSSRYLVMVDALTDREKGKIKKKHRRNSYFLYNTFVINVHDVVRSALGYDKVHSMLVPSMGCRL